MSVRAVAPQAPGTALFEEFESLLPYFNNLSEEVRSIFIKSIALLVEHLEISGDGLAEKTISELQPTLLRLRERYDQYRRQNIIIACAIFIVMAHIQSHYLTDPDANLVHNLTKLYIDRSRAAG